MSRFSARRSLNFTNKLAGKSVVGYANSAVIRMAISASDAVDGYSTGRESAMNVGADRVQRFRGAKHASDHDNGAKIDTAMIIRNPEKNFEELWKTFHHRYPFFELRNVDWKKQYDTYRPKVTREISDDELFDIFCQMLAPLHDGHVELIVKATGDRKKRYFTPEKKPRFWQEFTSREIKQLFKTTEKTLVTNGFGQPTETQAWMLHYCRSRAFGYIRILELEGLEL